jgi:ribonuclease HI
MIRIIKKAVCYAVRIGRKPGIYYSWGECEAQVKNFQGASYKKFNTIQEAKLFINSNGNSEDCLGELKGFKLFTDGGSRRNPGIAGCGAVLYNGNVKVASCYHFLGHQISNNVAEYYGIIHGLTIAEIQKVKILKIYSDSTLIINQLTGTWKISHPDMEKLNKKVKDSLKAFSSVSFEYIPREKNKEADILSNLAMDLALTY